ncbi:MAG TPA: DNA mismatch repair protein MutS [bacterium]
MTTQLSADKKLTPMMEQYRAIKATLAPDTVLFFRLGDFYEMFFEDAARASDILKITLTGRDGGEAGRVPMCGIPHHSSAGYIRTLLDHNLKVAVCEQLGDPKASKGLLERRVTRIITPATYLDEDDKATAAAYLAAVAGEGESCALAYLELSTGEFCLRELPRERLLSELSLLWPRELVLPKRLAADPQLARYAAETLRAGVTVYDDWIFEADEGARHLTEVFRVASAGAAAFSDRPLCVGAAGAVLYYLKDHLHDALAHVQVPRVLAPGDVMALDRRTQRSLELVASLNDRREASLLGCLDATRTSMGARRLHHWLLNPLLSVEDIRRRQDAVGDFVSHAQTGRGPDPGAVRQALGGIKDIERTLSRLACGVGHARDLLCVRDALARVPAVRTALEPARGELLAELAGQLEPQAELAGLISRAVTEHPPATIREGGIIRDGYSAELDELRGAARRGRAWMVEFERRESERAGIKSLRVKYSQVSGYAIEVSKPNLHLVPPDYQRRQTLANAERFVTPELKAWEEKISGAQERMKALEAALFGELKDAVLAELTTLQATARALGTLDALASLAHAAVRWRWCRPEVDESDAIDIEGGRHPLVESMLPAGQFVENDAVLDARNRQVVILTGPNMAGKSTYIRQVALIALLAHIGSFVPARRARIGLVDRIFTRIGASDHLAAGESTFMVEMIETAHLLRHATPRSLLILDEIGRGTSTFDGVSIAWAVCEYLVRGAAGPRTLFATHYHELIQLEAHSPRIHNASITVRETPDGIVFLRRVIPGGSDKSYGIHVAALAGMPKAVTERADAILAVLEREHAQVSSLLEPAPANAPGAPPPPAHPVLEAIRELDPDRLTPLEALARLAALRGELRRTEETPHGRHPRPA